MHDGDRVQFNSSSYEALSEMGLNLARCLMLALLDHGRDEACDSLVH